MCPDTVAKSAEPGLIMLADDTIRSVKSADLQTLPVPVPYVDNSVIDGEFNLNNCADVHIGNKYEHSGDIVIHQNIFNKSKSDIGSYDDSRISWSTLTHWLKGEMHCCFLDCKGITLSSTATVMCFVAITFILIIYFGASKPDSSTNGENIGTSSVVWKMENRSLHSKEQEEQYPLEKKFVLREAWGAAQREERGVPNKLPVERIILIHTVSAGTCNKYSACKQQVLQIQELHMDADHRYGDIGYNFVIGSDGYIYVGVGWNEAGSHTYGFNRNSLGVAFIGDFRFDEPNNLMISSLQRLLDFGVEIKKLSENYKLYGHCQLHTSFPLSPGKNIMSIVKTWPHWNNTNFNRCK